MSARTTSPRTASARTTTPHRASTSFAVLLAAVGTALLGVPAQAATPAPPIAFESDRDGDLDLYGRSADGTLRQLTSHHGQDFGAAWSPDGRRIAFVSDRDGDDEIWTMRADGTGLRQLTRNSGTRGGVAPMDHSPAWSPDGRHIAFTSNRDGGEMKVYRMRADGTGQVRLTHTARHVGDRAPSWSPGGGYIFFSSDRVSFDNVEIYRMRWDGSSVVRLTRTAAGIDDNAPDVSPDGRRVVFSSTRQGGQHDLFTMGSDGRHVSRLTGDPALDDVFPEWTPDGRSVVFATFAGAEGVPSADVWSVRADGTHRQVLSSPATQDSDPAPAPR